MSEEELKPGWNFFDQEGKPVDAGLVVFDTFAGRMVYLGVDSSGPRLYSDIFKDALADEGQR